MRRTAPTDLLAPTKSIEHLLQPYRIAAILDRFGSGVASDALQQRAYGAAIRRAGVIGRRSKAVPPKPEFLVFSADTPLLARLAALFYELCQLPHGRDRRGIGVSGLDMSLRAFGYRKAYQMAV